MSAYTAPQMQNNITIKRLDYRAVWFDARGLFAAHREAMVAIAGFFIFMPAWISSFLAPPFMLDTLDDTNKTIAALSGYFEANWPILLPTTLITMFGSLVLYVLLSGRPLAKVGDALAVAAAIFVPYLVASVLVGWATFAGILMLIIPGLYLAGRFAILPAVISSEGGLGVAVAIRRTWEITNKTGWAILVLMLFVAVLIRLVSSIAGGAADAVCTAIMGEGGIPILQSAVTALFVAVEAIAFVLMLVSVNRQLSAQTVSR